MSYEDQLYKHTDCSKSSYNLFCSTFLNKKCFIHRSYIHVLNLKFLLEFHCCEIENDVTPRKDTLI